MALIKCPECERDISDKAVHCIHCGYPLTTKTASLHEPAEIFMNDSKKYKVKLLSFNVDSKIDTIRVVRDFTNLPLPKAKQLVDTCPCYIANNVLQEDLQNIEISFNNIGASVEFEEMSLEEIVSAEPTQKIDSYVSPAEIQPQSKGIGFFGIVGAILLAVFILMFL